jgi:hypothetical protein
MRTPDAIAVRVALRYGAAVQTSGPADRVADIDTGVHEAIAAALTAVAAAGVALRSAGDRLTDGASAGVRERALRDAQLAGEQLRAAHDGLIGRLRGAQAELDRLSPPAPEVRSSRLAIEYQRRRRGLERVDHDDNDLEEEPPDGEAPAQGK